MIVDTAGRLHTQTNLMDELAKVRRVIAGRLEGAPHETLLVLDATTGQNGLQQARLFNEAVGVTGVVADEARRLREGRGRGRDRLRARAAGEADRRGRGPRRPASLRPRRLRTRARLAVGDVDHVDDVRVAAARVRWGRHRTPVFTSRTLDELAGAVT